MIPKWIEEKVTETYGNNACPVGIREATDLLNSGNVLIATTIESAYTIFIDSNRIELFGGLYQFLEWLSYSHFIPFTDIPILVSVDGLSEDWL